MGKKKKNLTTLILYCLGDASEVKNTLTRDIPDSMLEVSFKAWLVKQLQQFKMIAVLNYSSLIKQPAKPVEVNVGNSEAVIQKIQATEMSRQD